jgi:hypothetical protein
MTPCENGAWEMQMINLPPGLLEAFCARRNCSIKQTAVFYFVAGILFSPLEICFFNSRPTQKVIQRTKVFWWPVCIFACEILAIFRWQPAGKLARVEFQALRCRRRRNSLALQSGIRR